MGLLWPQYLQPLVHEFSVLRRCSILIGGHHDHHLVRSVVSNRAMVGRVMVIIKRAATEGQDAREARETREAREAPASAWRGPPVRSRPSIEGQAH
jgi:hypothetical protein